MKYIIIIIGLLIAWSSQAQQDVQYTQFMFNKMHFNPAYAGSRGNLYLSGLYRKQWIGIARAPQTAIFSGHGALLKARLGLGLSVTYDQIGFTNRVGIESNYSYIIRFKNESFLSLGLRASMYYTQIRWDQADMIDKFDTAVPQTATSRILPNFGAGIYYQSKNWYAGISVPHIFRNVGDFNISNSSGVVTPEFTQHYYAMGGFIFDVAKGVQIQQNMLLKYVVNAPLAMDINLSVVFVQRVLLGVTYRVNESVDVILQWQITRQLRIAMAYDIGITKLQEYNSGSVEAMISYWFVKSKDKDGDRALYNERFF